MKTISDLGLKFIIVSMIGLFFCGVIEMFVQLGILANIQSPCWRITFYCFALSFGSFYLTLGNGRWKEYPFIFTHRIILRKCHKKIIVWIGTVLLVVGIAAGMFSAVKLQKRTPKRPVICDRTGKTLLSDCRKSMFVMPKRHADCGGKFAAALLGHTVMKDGKRIGVCGVEYLIDHNAMTGDNLFLTLDAGVQGKCEAFLDDFCRYSVPQYLYITVIDSDGALIASAQRPVIDLNSRSKVAPRGMVFMASAYVFPVSDAWMRLLGSSSDAPPEEKIRFGFHRKLGIFPGEGKGAVPGAGQREVVKNLAQSATALNFLLACAGRMENKDIPNLKVFVTRGAALPAVKIGKDFQWHSLLWSKNCSTLSGLGSVSIGNGKRLYILLRIVFQDQYGVSRKPDKKMFPAEYCSLLEKVIRTFPSSGSISAEDDVTLLEMKIEFIHENGDLSAEEDAAQVEKRTTIPKKRREP